MSTYIVILCLVVVIICIYCTRRKNGIGFSQIGQDVDAMQYYNSSRYFVEVGVNDPININNTYLMEKLGWKGLLIEPLPNLKRKITKVRTSPLCQKAASNESRKVNFTIPLFDAFAGISDKIDAHKTFSNIFSRNIEVETDLLTNILNEYNAPSHIDFMSIDTEGNELEVLEGLDFDKYSIGYLTIEHNYVEPKRSKIEELLRINGYIKLKTNKFDDVYVPQK